MPDPTERMRRQRIVEINTQREAETRSKHSMVGCGALRN